jgi:hypothetical protein
MGGGLIKRLAGARHVGEHLAFELFGVGGFGLWHGVGFLFGSASLPVHQTGVTARAALRQEHFALPLKRLRQLALALQNRTLPRSGLGQACAYLLAHWVPLTAHLGHSITRLDTNAVENAIRPSKLGAKNWLFVGHPDAGDRPAVIYSLVLSCQRRRINPHDYLRDVLSRLPSMTSADDLRPLLPAHWRPAQAASFVDPISTNKS